MCSRALERRDGLIRWFERNRRDLPWRVPSKRRNELRDPYRSWVAEVMLQQTQVAAVVEKFEAWMKALPTLRSLAEADDALVERLWRGLGYYARARNLKKGAIRILERHDGEFPRDRAELERVPGIGPYSAGAILSLAFGMREAIVDGNVFRICARTEGWDCAVGDPAHVARAWEIAREFCDCARPDLANEALMELGALVCAPKAPKCAECPLRGSCASALDGRAQERPRPRAKAPEKSVVRTWVLVRSEGRILLRLPGRDPDGLLKDHFQIPSFPCLLSPAEVARKWPGAKVARCGTLKHSITNHRISGAVFSVGPAARGRAPEGCRWVPEAEADGLLNHALARKVLRAVAAHDADAAP